MSNILDKLSELLLKRGPRIDIFYEQRLVRLKEIDEIDDNILSFIKVNVEDIPVEVSIETLTKLGHEPQLVYNEGMFAILNIIFVPNNFHDSDDEIITPSLEQHKHMWSPTIREALVKYLMDIDL